MTRLSLLLALSFTLAPPYGVAAAARRGGNQAVAAGAGGLRESQASPDENVNGVVAAAERYVKSLSELLALREREAGKISARLGRMRRLRVEGVVSSREVGSVEAESAAAEAGVREVRLQIEAAEQFLAEALAEGEDMKPAVASRQTPARRPRAVKTAYFRNVGSDGWSLSGVARVENFFQGRFGRRLPVTAYGQSDLHTRWGFDHSNSVDVGLHPDSPEGRELVEYLRAAGIPFLAFRASLPGAATGPHIHIGRPSRKARAKL